MKLQSDNLLENLTSKQIESLTLEVRETLAKECKKEKRKSFSAAEFWAIQRRKRNLFTKRFAY